MRGKVEFKDDRYLVNTVKQLIALLLSVAMVSIAYGNPVLNSVTSGNVTVTQVSNATVVNQTSEQAIIQWNSFNIGAGEKTQFVQPNASAIALNRIDPAQGVSQIFGSLSANGRIILINPAGIFFGPHSMVNVGEIIASTANISNANFLAGNYVFDQASPYNGSIVNQGSIIAAQHGLVALLGSNVTNTGLVQAELGSIALGAGNTFTLDFYGDQLLNFSVNNPATQGGRVTNTGSLLADGGKILVTAEAAASVLDNAIDMEGVAQARSVGEKNGEIILSGHSGNVLVSGLLDTSGSLAGTAGGIIKISGDHIHLRSTANLNANGDIGGGEILIGGDAHGVGPDQNALTTTIDTGALLQANAISNGNGGHVVVWSNNHTLFAGDISATGGAQGGNGGNVEVSGGTLQYLGSVNLTAAKGNTGYLLLDPTTLEVVTGGSGTIISGENDNSSTTIDPSTVDSALNSANLILNADTNITITNGITWTSGNTLTLSTNTGGSTININAPISGVNGSLIINTAGATDVISTSSAGAVNVNSFILQSGAWTQIAGQGSLSAASLPSFSSPNDFEIQGGTFLRVAGGDGTSTLTPYQITDIYGLQGMSGFLSSDFVLDNNIDATVTSAWNSGAGFSSIGNNASAFTGDFNGQNYTISHYFSTTQGMFGENDGTIENLGLISPVITINSGSGNIGGLVGFNRSTINNVYITNLTLTINGGSFSDVGGLVGKDGDYDFSHGIIYPGNIYDSYVTGTVTNNATVNNLSLFLGEINSDGTLQNDYAVGTINNTPSTASGGNIALMLALNSDFFGNSISNSYAIGTINNTDVNGSEIIGGLMGFTYTHSSNNFAIVDINNNDTGTSPDELLGGLVGWAYGGPITNSYSQGVISSNTPNGGGVSIGGITAQSYGDIIDSYAAVSVINNSLTSNRIGGITADGASFSSSFFDADVAGTTNGANAGCFSGTCTNGTYDLSAQATFENAGWDFTNTWGIIEGSSYPYLKSFYAATPRAISGFTDLPVTLKNVQLEMNGNNLTNNANNGVISVGSTYTGANGFYYFLESSGVIPDSSQIVISFIDGTPGIAKATAPSGGGSITGLNISNNPPTAPSTTPTSAAPTPTIIIANVVTGSSSSSNYTTNNSNSKNTDQAVPSTAYGVSYVAVVANDINTILQDQQNADANIRQQQEISSSCAN